MRAPEALSPLSFSLSLSSFHSVCLLPYFFFFFYAAPPTVMWWSAEYCPVAKLHICQYHRNPAMTFIVIYLSYLNDLRWPPVMLGYLTLGEVYWIRYIFPRRPLRHWVRISSLIHKSLNSGCFLPHVYLDIEDLQTVKYMIDFPWGSAYLLHFLDYIPLRGAGRSK